MVKHVDLAFHVNQIFLSKVNAERKSVDRRCAEEQGNYQEPSLMGTRKFSSSVEDNDLKLPFRLKGNAKT